MGILKILTIALIVLFPIGEIGKVQFGNGVSVSVNDLLLLLLAGSGFITLFLKRKEVILKSNLAKPIFLFVSVGFVSLILNIGSLTITTFIISFLYLVRFASSAVLYFIVQTFDEKFKTKILNLMLISGFVIVLTGYIQYFFYPSLKNLFYLGWDEHLYRMFSSFLDPNFAGAFFVIYFLFSVNFFRLALGKKDKNKVILFFLISMATLIAIYLTYSRSAFLMLVAASTTYLFLINKKKLIIYALIVLVALIFLSPKAFQTEGTNFLRTNSSTDRIKSSAIALRIFEDSPIIGVGFNAYRYAQNKLGMNTAYWQTTHSGAGTDNSFLFVLATTGIVGFLSYLYLLYKILKLAKNNSYNSLSPVLFSCLVGLLINGFFINSLFYILILEWIWLMSGLIEKKQP